MARRHSPYSTDELKTALQKLNARKQVSGLPLAVAIGSSPGHTRLMLGVHNMVRLFMRCPRYWLQQPVYQKRKAGRALRQFSSYRDLCLGNFELRIAEELWAARNVDGLWDVAAPQQLGRSDSLFAVYLDVECSLVRQGLGLPTGTLDADLA